MIRARQFVVSSLNPHQTFLDLLDEALVPREIRDRVKAFQYNLLAPLFALHLNLREPPRYTASAKHPELAKAFMVIMGLDHVDQFGDIVRHHEAGTIPPTVMWGACPTLFDPSQAPPGHAHRLHVGEAAVPPQGIRTGRASATSTARRCLRCGGSTRPISPTP